MSPRELLCECGNCRICKARERLRISREKNREHINALRRERNKFNRERQNETKKRYWSTPHGRAVRERAAAEWRARNPEKVRAAWMVRNALKKGVLVKGQCARLGDSCAGTITAHHEDYSKPLEVVWVCTRHHYELDQARRQREAA